MIVRKTANNAIKIAIIFVVPQPGATLPYSEFKGFRMLPKTVTFPLEFDILFFEIVVILNILLTIFTFFNAISINLILNINLRALQKDLLNSLPLAQNQYKLSIK